MIKSNNINTINNIYVIFDGNCGFCNKTLMFIARNDKNNTLQFVSSLSIFGKKLLLNNKINGLEKSTIILVEKGNKYYIKSIAIRRILLKIPFYKMIGYLMFLFPNFILNIIYDFISINRKIIIKNNTCQIPNSKTKNKFIL